MNRYKGKMLLAFDVVTVLLSYLLALTLRHDFSVRSVFNHEGFFGKLPLVALVYMVAFLLFKTYKSVWETITIEEGYRIVMANVLSSSVLFLLHVDAPKRALPPSVIIIASVINTLFQLTMRFSYRSYCLSKIIADKKKLHGIKRVLIYGAGNSGSFIATAINRNHNYRSYVVGFIDDKPHLKGKYVAGSIVFGGVDIISKIILEQYIDEIIIAMPNQTEEKQNRIVYEVFKLGLPVKLSPKVETLFEQENGLKNSLKKIEIVDLLARKENIIKDDKVSTSIFGKSILVTGAAGSIGSELVKQILKCSPKRVVLIDIYENGLYELQQEILREVDHTIELHFLVTSIRDNITLNEIFETYNFDLIFHAAAFKHVPLMEQSPAEAIKNNIFGTYNLIELAKTYNVKKFVNISTDKAVNPTNVMGATKRFNEMMLQSQPKCNTKFSAVRFGNVLGSNGSVVPLFTKQIEAGGPITLTHKNITRYFMTVSEAVSLVLQAETYAQGGEIFVLDMGDPVKIYDLATRMIELSGYKPHVEIEIAIIGLRPGEKLYEELLMTEEGMRTTANERIFVAEPVLTPLGKLEEHLENLRKVIDNQENSEVIVANLAKAVPTFTGSKQWF